jgi:hypothetical protein
MISELGLAGYKAFSAPVTIRPRRITVIFGKNNSGKTSLVRAPLFIRSALGRPGLYSLQQNDTHFGSSIQDLTSSDEAYPSLSYSISVTGGESIGVTLRRTLTTGLIERVIPTGAFYVRSAETPRHAVEVKSPAAQSAINQVLASFSEESATEFEATRTGIINQLADIIHVPSTRPEIEEVYTVREPTSWVPGETPHCLATDDEVASDVEEWTANTFGGPGVRVDRSTFAFRLAVGRAAASANLAQAGRGVQASLSVATALLAVARGKVAPSTVLIEEPEVHVHPSGHGDLADLVLLAADGSSSQVIVETHSEHFLLRLRRRVAEGTANPDDIAMIYLDENHQPRLVELNRGGVPDDWPIGVFEYDVEETRAIVDARLRMLRTHDPSSS